MNKEQETFLNFILERVKDGKAGNAKELLEEMFKKQEDGTFNALHLAGFIPKMTGMIKPEYLKEATEIFEKFSKSKG